MVETADFGNGKDRTTLRWLQKSSAESSAAKLSSKNSTLSAQVIDRLLSLSLVHPSSNRNKHEPEWVQAQRFVSLFSMFEFLDGTGANSQSSRA